MSTMPGDARRERLRVALRELTAALLFAAVVMGATSLLYVGAGIPVAHLLKDPGALRPGPWYLGAVSYVGILLWTAAATVCLFARKLLRREEDAELRHFLLGSALLSALLGLDDLFMLHDNLAPNYLGISEKAVIASYGALALAYVARFRHMVWRSEFVPLLVAGAFFALSVGVDALDVDDARFLLVEDGAKLAGIAGWCSYLAHASGEAVRTGLASLRPEAAPAEPRSAAVAAQ